MKSKMNDASTKSSITYWLSIAVLPYYAFFYWEKMKLVERWSLFSLVVLFCFLALYTTNAIYARMHGVYRETDPKKVIVILVVFLSQIGDIGWPLAVLTGAVLLAARSAWAGVGFRQIVWRELGNKGDYPDKLKRFDVFHSLAALTASLTFPIIGIPAVLDVPDWTIAWVALPTAALLLIGHLRLRRRNDAVGFHLWESLSMVAILSVFGMVFGLAAIGEHYNIF